MIELIYKKSKIIINYLWKLFLNGLLTILPIALTIAIFKITITFIISWLEPLRRIVPPYLDIPYGEVIVAILLTFLIGTILKIFVLRSIINLIEQVITKLPLVRPVYTGFKQLIHAFSGKDKITFKKVVLVEFPRKEMFSIGFMTSKLDPKLAPSQDKDYFNIFIPTTPNPTSGYFIILPEKEIHIVNITRQEAMALIISAGIIQPEATSYHINNQT